MRLQLLFSLSTDPVNSMFSVVVRIYKFLVIAQAFFPYRQPLPWKVRKCLFHVSLLNIATNSFNTIMQLINPNFAWKNRLRQIKTTQKNVAMVYLRTHCEGPRPRSQNAQKFIFFIFTITYHTPEWIWFV